MSRVPLGEFFALNAVGDSTARLQAVEGATVVIQKRSDLSPVVVYDAETAGAPIDPVLTNHAGMVPGWVDAPGAYQAVITKTGEIDDLTIPFDAPITDTSTVQLLSEKDQPSGYAGLDSGGLIPASRLPVDLMETKGTWNANTNTPTLEDGTGNDGDTYRVTVAGAQDLGSGSKSWLVGDYVVYDGSVWQHLGGAASGGGGASDLLLMTLAGMPESLIYGTITRAPNGAIATAGVVWPDETIGTYTAVLSDEFPGETDSYEITHVDDVYSQPTVTRDDVGGVIIRPRIELAGGGSDGASLANIIADSGQVLQWEDDCSEPDPLEAERWCTASLQTVDDTGLAIEFPDNFSTPHAVETDPAPRFLQSPSGGPGNKPYYQWFAPAGDNIYSDGGRGRASIEYPKGDPGGVPGGQVGPPGAFFMYEGRRQLFRFSTYLPVGWDINSLDPDDGFLPWWRLLAQWKQNEWVAVVQDSPQLSLQQRGNAYIMTMNDDADVDQIVWSMPATGTVGGWLDWIADITFSVDPDIGKIRLHMDYNNDGNYEYDSGDITNIQTLCPRIGGGDGVEANWSLGVYEKFGGDTLRAADFGIYGTPGG